MRNLDAICVITNLQWMSFEIVSDRQRAYYIVISMNLSQINPSGNLTIKIQEINIEIDVCPN